MTGGIPKIPNVAQCTLPRRPPPGIPSLCAGEPSDSCAEFFRPSLNSSMPFTQFAIKMQGPLTVLSACLFEDLKKSVAPYFCAMAQSALGVGFEAHNATYKSTTATIETRNLNPNAAQNLTSTASNSMAESSCFPAPIPEKVDNTNWGAFGGAAGGFLAIVGISWGITIYCKRRYARIHFVDNETTPLTGSPSNP